jgi:hypothetical protein
MSDPVPAVTEAVATGEIADIFADIRHVHQVAVVNLIWRHLATFPGALTSTECETGGPPRWRLASAAGD